MRPVLALGLTSKGATIGMAILDDHLPFALLFGAALALVAGLAFIMTTGNRFALSRNELLPIVLACLLVTSLNVFGSLADGSDALRGLGGDRYYLLGRLCVLLVLALVSRTRGLWGRVSVGLLGGLLVVQLAYAAVTQVPVRYNYIASRPSQIDRCVQSRQSACRLLIWPNAPGQSDWSVALTRQELASWRGQAMVQAERSSGRSSVPLTKASEPIKRTE